MWATVGYGAAGLLALLMFKSSPPRAPKTATLLAMVSGFGLAGWAAGLLSTVLGWVDGILGQWFGVSVIALAFFAMLYVVFNALMPKVGKVAGGSAGFGTAIMAFLLPTFAVAAGGTIAGFYLDVAGGVGESAAQFANQGF